MIDWQRLFHDHIVKNAYPLQKICNPLKSRLGVPFFGYHHIGLDGQYVVLTDSPGWAENYLANKFYLDDPFLKHPSVYSSGLSLFSCFEKQSESKKMSEAWCETVQTNDGIVLIEKTSTGVEFFIFGGPLRNEVFNKIILNHHALLFAFADYFRKESQGMLARQYKEGYYLKFTSTCSSESRKVRFDPKVDNSQQREFLASLGLKTLDRQLDQLTPRERECLLLLLECKTIKEVAFCLKLSSRTVEYYLNNAKMKMDCSNKQELLSQALLLKRYGLL